MNLDKIASEIENKHSELGMVWISNTINNIYQIGYELEVNGEYVDVERYVKCDILNAKVVEECIFSNTINDKKMLEEIATELNLHKKYEFNGKYFNADHTFENMQKLKSTGIKKTDSIFGNELCLDLDNGVRLRETESEPGLYTDGIDNYRVAHKNNYNICGNKIRKEREEIGFIAI